MLAEKTVKIHFQVSITENGIASDLLLNIVKLTKVVRFVIFLLIFL